MLENFLFLARDIAVIGYSFVLRIGVPIIVTLFIGWWLERKLVEWDARDAQALQEQDASDQAKQTLQRPTHLN